MIKWSENWGSEVLHLGCSNLLLNQLLCRLESWTKDLRKKVSTRASFMFFRHDGKDENRVMVERGRCYDLEALECT